MVISRSGYYRYLKSKGSKKEVLKNKLLLEVKALAAETRYSYGKRRVSKHLQSQGYKVGVHAARTLMYQANVTCKQRRKYRTTTKSNHALLVAENVLDRQFVVTLPNRVWVADITYLWTLEGWVYIAAVVDVFSRRVVGWALDSHMRESLVNRALQMALGRRQPITELLHHSDRGVQYASTAYQNILKSAHITVSMSRKGNCWDNAVMERLWGSLKTERTDGTIYVTRQQAMGDVIDYFEMFYNSKRLHSTLGYVSPLQFENQFRLKNMSTFT